MQKAEKDRGANSAGDVTLSSKVRLSSPILLPGDHSIPEPDLLNSRPRGLAWMLPLPPLCLV
jgi:hypothetical protein